MVKLSQFRTDSRAVTEGEWVALGGEWGDLEIRTRGITDAYLDAQAARQRKAARGYNGDVNLLPVAIRRAINIECLIEHVVLDVRNLTDDDGNPVPFDRFCDLLRQPDYFSLVVACMAAAQRVGEQRVEDIDAAAGNSARPSAGS